MAGRLETGRHEQDRSIREAALNQIDIAALSVDPPEEAWATVEIRNPLNRAEILRIDRVPFTEAELAAILHARESHAFLEVVGTGATANDRPQSSVAQEYLDTGGRDFPVLTQLRNRASTVRGVMSAARAASGVRYPDALEGFAQATVAVDHVLRLQDTQRRALPTIYNLPAKLIKHPPSRTTAQ